ncbi:MAG: sigma-70 family RNA polymerase sigma factor [Enhygromyxa sp.]
MPRPSPALAPEPAPPREQFDALYRRELGFVWRMLRYHGVPDAAVEDAVQEVFVVVHRRWADWDHQRSPRSWLFGIVRRVAAAQRRSASRHERRVRAAPSPEPTPAIEAQAASRHELEQLQRALAQMDEKLATVFVLAEVEGLSGPEIAELLGAKLNTVYWRLRTARAQISAAMAAREDSER